MSDRIEPPFITDEDLYDIISARVRSEDGDPCVCDIDPERCFVHCHEPLSADDE